MHARTESPLLVSRVRPAYQQVADQLRELILDGKLCAGDRLPSEADLGSQFGVSRSTVREALRALASRDLIHTTRGPAGGTFISQVKVEKISDYLEASIGLLSGDKRVTVQEMLEARDVLEVPAARLAAERRQACHLEAMRAAIEREMTTRGRSDRFAEHRDFHQVIVEASGNVLLGMMNEPVFRVLQAKFLRPTVPEGFWATVDHDHAAILTAIGDRDAPAAGLLMAEHLVALRDAYTD